MGWYSEFYKRQNKEKNRQKVFPNWELESEKEETQVNHEDSLKAVSPTFENFKEQEDESENKQEIEISDFDEEVEL